MQDVVKLDRVCKVYNGVDRQIVALDHTDIGIRAGEFVSILGPSGCGKTTLLKLIAGLDRPTEGKAWVNGRVVDKPATDLGIVFQDAALLDWRRVLENVMIQIEVRGLS